MSVFGPAILVPDCKHHFARCVRDVLATHGVHFQRGLIFHFQLERLAPDVPGRNRRKILEERSEIDSPMLRRTHRGVVYSPSRTFKLGGGGS